MSTVLVTGSDGFIGRNLVVALQRLNDVVLKTFDIDDDLHELEAALLEADVIYHLAGVNRPENDEEFDAGNAGLTRNIVEFLADRGRAPRIVMSSSTQAELDNAYGRSKKKAEEALIAYGEKTGASVHVYRLPNVFGKWSRPNYNSVVATFCHNICRGQDIVISDGSRVLELVYIDDVVAEFIGLLAQAPGTGQRYYSVDKRFKVTLAELADRIYKLKEIRESLLMPDLDDDLMKNLYATYLSFLDKDQFAYPLDLKTDDRGSLFELLKSKQFGQIFVSKTHAGVIRGNHYHDSKVEKFCVIQGKAVIKFRHIAGKEVLSYNVSGENIEVVDIPPGYTHSIRNLSDGEMIVLFWANRIFDSERPDTYYLEVESE